VGRGGDGGDAGPGEGQAGAVERHGRRGGPVGVDGDVLEGDGDGAEAGAADDRVVPVRDGVVEVVERRLDVADQRGGGAAPVDVARGRAVDGQREGAAGDGAAVEEVDRLHVVHGGFVGGQVREALGQAARAADEAGERERRAGVDGVDDAGGAGGQDDGVAHGACGQAVVLEGAAVEGEHAAAQGGVAADDQVADRAREAAPGGDRG